MCMRPLWFVALGLLAGLEPLATAAAAPPLPGVAPLDWEGDLSARMVAGLDRFLLNETAASPAKRAGRWHRDFATAEVYTASVATNRARLRALLGVVDERVPDPRLEAVSDLDLPVAEETNALYRVLAVRWTVFEGVHGEGLLLRPLHQPPVATVIALPDADQTPEMLAGLAPGLPSASQFARRLAEQGCEVLVPVLVDRQDDYSGNPRLQRFTNQPHREWLYRQAFEMGRTLPGCEVQKVLAAVDWFEQRDARVGPPASPPRRLKLAIAGYGEGGLIALYAAALDPRLAVALVSGYFDSRQNLWQEPIYRNVFGLLTEFGDAEIASLIAPRKLVVEFSEPPRVAGPPASRPGRSGAAPGKIETCDFQSVAGEVERAKGLVKAWAGEPTIELVHGAEGMLVAPGSEKALARLLNTLTAQTNPWVAAQPPPPFFVSEERLAARQQRQVRELEAFTQQLMRQAERVRAARTWDRLKGGEAPAWQALCASNRDFLWREVIGRLPDPTMPPGPRARLVLDQPDFTADEVVLDVFPEVFAWGWLLRPKDLRPGEKRPVVVCQHGLEGLPEDVVTEDKQKPAYGPYRGYAAQLARQGFIVYAPHNPYRGGDAFRTLQRKANPLGLSLFSVIIAQHQATLAWLASLPFVDATRIGFYGLSYGGKTAMRVPAVLETYRCSICSADFNDWIQKNVTVDSGYSYLYTGEYEMPEWNLGHTFNYAELAMLIAPRPFMVERGHDDGVAPDSWVASEFAKVRRGYVKLGLADRAEIEFFDGPHSIHGVGTFRFLRRHLDWPERP